MKQQKKFSNHAMPARRPRKTQGKCVLFADAAKLYIECSEAVTSAETAVKRMRFFAQFYNASFAERDIASISPSDVYRWFDGVITAKRRDGKGCYAPRTLRSVWGQLYTFLSWCSTRYPVQTRCTPSKCPAPAPRNATDLLAHNVALHPPHRLYVYPPHKCVSLYTTIFDCRRNA